MNQVPHHRPRLNLVGCGRLGRSLARLWHAAGSIEMGGLHSRSAASAASASAFIGAGHWCATPAALPPAEITLVAVPDSAIAGVATALAQRPGGTQGVIFHCSGLHASAVLAPLRAAGAAVASAHPLHSFADPVASLASFAGSLCTLEGDSRACAVLAPLFGGIGAEVVAIDPTHKPLYHAAAAMASNHLVALLDSSLAMLAHAGIPAPLAAAMLAPLVRQTATNVFADGPTAALTGPIARGDDATVATHLDALGQTLPPLAPLYRALARATLAIAARRSDFDAAAGIRLRALLDGQG